MNINRQHHETEIPELIGAICESFLAVGSSSKTGFSMFFIKLSGITYKFFLDESVLFWDKSDQDPEDDLGDEVSYIDLRTIVSINFNIEVKRISMSSGKLKIQFPNQTLVFSNTEDLTYIEEI